MPPEPRKAETPEKTDIRTILFSLWTFVMFNYVYADLFGVMDSRLLPGFLEGRVGDLELTPGFFVGAAILMQIPMLALLLTRLLPRAEARWVNIGAGAFKTIVVFGTLFIGENTAYYLGYSVVEIIATSAIVVIAWRWVPARAAAADRADIQSFQPGAGTDPFHT